jgi:hypothetical protein
MSEPRKKKIQLGVWFIESSAGWNSSTILFRDGSGDGPERQCLLSIRSPAELSYVQEHLDKIKAEWKRQVASLSA